MVEVKPVVTSDEKTGLRGLVLEELRKRDHNVRAYGLMAGEQMDGRTWERRLGSRLPVDGLIRALPSARLTREILRNTQVGRTTTRSCFAGQALAL